ncbi:MAG: hypothetical protein NT031_11725 [Planctomycetota bacterium]|nr:hypothetical protein [Planctomycetota bacterium]
MFLGEIPPAMDRVSRNKTKYIQSVSFARSRHRDTAEVWFHDSVAINHELVAIIGNKGGGKSALADVLGLLGNTSHGDCFSFLTAKKFRDPKCNKARCFDATLTWETGSTVTKHLDEEVDPSAVETIRYVPQHYLETICNELGVPGKTAFSKELRAVIFSHVDEADRLGFDSLDAVIEFRTKETDAAIAILKTSLESVIKQYVSLRERASVTHKQTIESQLAQKKLELQAHDETKPIPVTKPDSDPATQQRMEAVAKQIEERAAEVVSFEAEIAALTDGRAKDVKSVSIADKLAGRIENVRVVIEQFRTESAADCEALGLNLDDLVKVTIDLTPLQTRRQRLASDARNKAALLKPENVNSPEFKRLAREKDIASLKTALDEPNRHYQAYLKATKDWQVKHDAMLGDAENVGTIRYYERQLEALAALPQELAQAEGELTALMLRIYREIKKLADVYKGLYRPVQEFIEDHPLARNKFHLGFRADITVVGLEDEFLEMINQGRTGSFCGSDEGRGRLHGIVGRAGFDSEEGVQAFVTEMLKHLRYDLRTDGEPVGIPVKDQLRKGVGEELVYAFLFALGYLKPDYNLSWCGKDVEQLSPGERGTLLLVFYLLIDRSDIPLVVDQPEENLDNQTVYDILVPSIKEAKSRRQIIIVTHNPNLAVVCDADQVIWASLDKEANSSLKYVTGAIENPLINPKVVDILEGTQPAFDNRDAKYRSVTDRGPR